MSYYTTLYGTYGRLELALKDTSKMNNLYDKTISTLCMGLYYFYHNSALNREKKELILAAMFVGRIEPNEEAL
jgi:hypothetical protein